MNHQYAMVFFIAFGTFGFFSAVLTTENCGNVKLFKIPANITEINITACGGIHNIKNRIIGQELTLSEAMASCQMLKFGSISHALPQWISRTDVRKYLEDIKYKNLNYTFWFGVFRPRPHVRNWYSYASRGVCKEQPNKVPSGDPYTGQCAVIHRNESDFYRESLHIEDCNKHHPYVCKRSTGCLSFLAYLGFDVTESPLGAKRKDLMNVSLDVCKVECYNYSGCNAFSYFNNSRICRLFLRRKGYGALNYALNISSNVTHYAKTGCTVEFISDTNYISVTNTSTNLPDCGIQEVPSSYCPCDSTLDGQDETVANTDDIVNEIVAHLTIDRKSTSANQRKLTSSSDDRKTSKAFGLLGIIMIAGTLSLLVLADLFLPSYKRSMETQKTRQKKNRK